MDRDWYDKWHSERSSRTQIMQAAKTAELERVRTLHGIQERIGGTEEVTKTLAAAGIRISGMAFFDLPLRDIEALLDFSRAAVAGQDPYFPLPHLDRRLLPGTHQTPWTKEEVRDTEVIFLRLPDYNVFGGHADGDVEWLRRIGFNAGVRGREIAISVPRQEVVTETERLADVMEMAHRRGLVKAVYLPRSERAAITWER